MRLLWLGFFLILSLLSPLSAGELPPKERVYRLFLKRAFLVAPQRLAVVVRLTDQWGQTYRVSAEEIQDFQLNGSSLPFWQQRWQSKRDPGQSLIHAPRLQQKLFQGLKVLKNERVKQEDANRIDLHPVKILDLRSSMKEKYLESKMDAYLENQTTFDEIRSSPLPAWLGDRKLDISPKAWARLKGVTKNWRSLFRTGRERVISQPLYFKKEEGLIRTAQLKQFPQLTISIDPQKQTAKLDLENRQLLRQAQQMLRKMEIQYGVKIAIFPKSSPQKSSPQKAVPKKLRQSEKDYFALSSIKKAWVVDAIVIHQQTGKAFYYRPEDLVLQAAGSQKQLLPESQRFLAAFGRKQGENFFILPVPQSFTGEATQAVYLSLKKAGQTVESRAQLFLSAKDREFLTGRNIWQQRGKKLQEFVQSKDYAQAIAWVEAQQQEFNRSEKELAYPLAAHWIYWQAKAHIGRGALPAARALLQRLVQQYPWADQADEAWVMLAEVGFSKELEATVEQTSQ